MMDEPPQATVTGNPVRLRVAYTYLPATPGDKTEPQKAGFIVSRSATLVHADGSQDAPQDVAVFDTSRNEWVPTPISLGVSVDTTYLVLYGTGIRRHSLVAVCTIAGLQVPVAFAGAQSAFPGLDQVNVALPRSLRGAGSVDVTLMVDGVASNTVTVVIQ